ncbi:MAG: 3-dehydroquinate synthase [bacterium]|nr:3-dehydroquinate synthase [bacterium]
MARQLTDVIRLEAPAFSDGYDIIIEPDGLKRFAHRVPAQAVIVTNDTLAALYREMLAEALPQAKLITIPDGEAYKTLETTARLYDEFVRAGLDRRGVVVAFGGGVVGDTAGFAAATYMRGVYLLQVPTSLLAMVDSSVGGKVGVDLLQGKNLVGAFKQPDLVIMDPNLLQTLPDIEWRCGMAEVIKHGLLADDALLDPALWEKSRAQELVKRAVMVKVEVVQQDPFEQGIRAHLNLGHTFAHAIEQVTAYGWKHGVAVGVGLLAAAKLSHALSLCDASLVTLVDETLERVGLPRSIGTLDPDAIYAAMATDKKFQHGKSRFILLRGVGQPVIVEDVPKAEVIRVLEGLRSL